jgi:hypothetical protein
MSAAAIVGYALVGVSDTLVVVGTIGAAVITVVGGIVQTVMANSSANKRQRRELQYRGGRKSSMAAPLFIATAALVAIAIYVSTRPDEKPNVASSPPTLPTTLAGVAQTAVPAAEPTEPAELPGADLPITLEEASAFVNSYLERSTREDTEEQAWAMFTESHKLVFKRGLDEFRDFWRTVDTVNTIAAPVLTSESDTRAKLVASLTYKLFEPNRFGVDCTEEKDTFTLVRVDGALQIDGYDPVVTKEC